MLICHLIVKTISCTQSERIIANSHWYIIIISGFAILAISKHSKYLDLLFLPDKALVFLLGYASG